jgi:SAM-dependent methyltransferase
MMQVSNSTLAGARQSADPADAANDVLPWQDALAVVQDFLLARFSRRPIRIYEAGGGSLSYLPAQLLETAEVTAVDIDVDQLKKNSYARTKICGDIQVKEFPPGSFDLIVCNYVIEHLDRPGQAIDRFFSALEPGGLLFIAAPNPRSFTPHWFHVLYYRLLLGNKNAGRPGNAPFPIVYHPLASPARLIEYCKRGGYRVAYFREFESVQLGNLRQRHPALSKILNALLRGVEIVSRRNIRCGDFHIVLERPA